MAGKGRSGGNPFPGCWGGVWCRNRGIIGAERAWTPSWEAWLEKGFAAMQAVFSPSLSVPLAAAKAGCASCIPCRVGRAGKAGGVSRWVWLGTPHSMPQQPSLGREEEMLDIGKISSLEECSDIGTAAQGMVELPSLEALTKGVEVAL